MSNPIDQDLPLPSAEAEPLHDLPAEALPDDASDVAGLIAEAADTRLPYQAAGAEDAGPIDTGPAATHDWHEEVQSLAQGEAAPVPAQDSSLGDLTNSEQAVKSHPLYVKRTGRSGTVEQTRPITMPIGEINQNEETLMIPPMHPPEATAVVQNITAVDFENDPQAKRWLELLRRSYYASYSVSTGMASLAREGSQWRQSVPSNMGELSATAYLPPAPSGTALTGDQALVHLNNALGTGNMVVVPLWHSGFWVVLNTPSDSELLDLHENILSERESIARDTYGRAFSNYTAIFRAHMIDFVMAHVHTTTLKENVDFRELVTLHDIDQMIWAMGAATWPRGWQYVTSILGDPSSPTSIRRQRIRIGNMNFTDISRLTEWQRNHMAIRNKRHATREDIERYRKEFSHMGNRYIDLPTTEGKPETKVEIRVPNVLEYVESGRRWVTDIVTLYESVATRQGGVKGRDDYVRKQSKAQRLRMFSHWVERIIIGESEITDRDVILKALTQMSGDDATSDRIISGVQNYIDDTLVSIIAVPTEQEEEAPLPAFPHLIPLDPGQLFFIQLVQKETFIRAR